MILTILTPAYNRGGDIRRLYDSLENQSRKDFEWLIVDDGSTDDTEQVVREMQAEATFPIHYIHKENGGKHTALNVGISAIKSELTFIVDSDDTLTSDAVAEILRYHERYRGMDGICGYVFLRKFSDGVINGKQFIPSERIDTYIETRVNADDTHADKAEVFFTECLKEFPFPEYPGERFLGEDLVWIRMVRKYSMVHINKATYVGEYQADGLTKNRRKNNIHAPIGCLNRAKEFMGTDIKNKYRIKGGLQYIIYGRFAGYSLIRLLKESNHRMLVLFCMLPGMFLYVKWRKEYT